MKIILTLHEDIGLQVETEGGWTLHDALASLEHAKLVMWEQYRHSITQKEETEDEKRESTQADS